MNWKWTKKETVHKNMFGEVFTAQWLKGVAQSEEGDYECWNLKSFGVTKQSDDYWWIAIIKFPGKGWCIGESTNNRPFSKKAHDDWTPHYFNGTVFDVNTETIKWFETFDDALETLLKLRRGDVHHN